MLIWGWQRRVNTLAMITFLCSNCHNPSAHALRALVTKFTLFFIPLFPISTKHHLDCTWCGARFPVPNQDVNNLLAQAHAQQNGMPMQSAMPQPNHGGVPPQQGGGVPQQQYGGMPPRQPGMPGQPWPPQS